MIPAAAIQKDVLEKSDGDIDVSDIGSGYPKEVNRFPSSAIAGETSASIKCLVIWSALSSV